MQTYLLISFIADDRPGLVQSLSEAVAAHGGNWLESRMANLAGKFAGIVNVSVPQARRQDLEGAREDERERQRASRARRRESVGHAGASPPKVPLSHGQIAAIVDRALAPSRASLVLQMGVFVRRSGLDLGNAWRLSRGSLGP